VALGRWVIGVIAVVLGGGVALVVPRPPDIGAWLGVGNKGTVANGLSGRIDPPQLTVAESWHYGAAGAEVVAGSGRLYVIDPAAGTVQRVNPDTLATIGGPVRLPPALTSAGPARTTRAPAPGGTAPAPRTPSQQGPPDHTGPPAAPQDFQVSGVNHGADLQWAAPANAAAQPVTYRLSWNGGTQDGITGTSASVTGLTNGQQYTFTLTAANAAGSGQAATATLTLTPPPHNYQIWNNSDSVLYVDSAPSPAGTNGSTPVGSIPAGQAPTVAVQCQVQAGTATDPFDHTSDNIWDRVTWNGQTAYISDMYVNTANSLARNYDSFTGPPLWECT
jgi:hypothetical protein